MVKKSIALTGISLGSLLVAACGSNSLPASGASNGGQMSTAEGGAFASSGTGGIAGGLEGGPPDGRTTNDDAFDVAKLGMPCSVDSDCGNPFLTCVAQQATMCRDPNSQDPSAGMPRLGNVPVALPTCPTTAEVTANLCSVRYQLPCRVDSDCGPDGFTCPDGRCSSQPPAQCTDDRECPQGWSCSDPCCGGRMTKCYPPYSVTSCGLCGALIDG
jgi:hypothetical protein